MKKVFFVIHAPHWGGPHVIIERIARDLQNLGWEQIGVIPIEDGDSAERFRKVGVIVDQIPLGRLRKSLNPLTHIFFFLKLPVDIFKIWRLIRQKNADVVQIVGLLHFHASIAALLAGKPIVWQLHSNLPPAFLRRMIMVWVRQVADVLMTSGTGIISTHPGACKFGERLFSFMAPVDSSIFAPDNAERQHQRKLLGIPKDAVLIGTVGNRVWMKRHDLFVKVACRVLEKRKNVYFRIFGAPVPASNNYYEKNVVALAKRKGLLKKGVFNFIDPGKDVSNCLKAMDIFLMTSTKEGTSIVTQEAMATGLPVVAIRAGSLPDAVIPGSTGFLSKKADVYELANYICMLVDNSKMRQEFGREARSGTIFHDSYPRFFQLRYLVNLSAWAGIFLVARLLGKKVLMLGVGIGPFALTLSKMIAALGLKACHLVAVRDDASMKEIFRWVPETRRIKTFDLAALLAQEQSFYQNYSHDSTKLVTQVLGISVLSLAAVNPARQKKHWEFWGTFSDALLVIMKEQPNLQVRVFVMWAAPNRDNDIKPSAELVSCLNESFGGRTTLISYNSDPSETFRAIQECVAFVATRYHAAVLAYLGGCQLMTVPYHRKVRDFSEEIGLSSDAQLFPYQRHSVSDISDRFRSLISGNKIFRPKLPVPQAIQTSQINVGVLKRFVEN